MMHKVAEWSWGWASQLFCCSLGPSAPEKITWHQGQKQHCAQDRTAQVVQNVPPTLLILNISNSNLINCVIGNNSHLTMDAEYQSLMHESGPQMHSEESGCGQQGATPSPPPPPPPHLPLVESATTSIHSSNLSCVIIGDHNSMSAETNQL